MLIFMSLIVFLGVQIVNKVSRFIFTLIFVVVLFLYLSPVCKCGSRLCDWLHNLHLHRRLCQRQWQRRIEVLSSWLSFSSLITLVVHIVNMLLTMPIPITIKLIIIVQHLHPWWTVTLASGKLHQGPCGRLRSWWWWCRWCWRWWRWWWGWWWFWGWWWWWWRSGWKLLWFQFNFWEEPKHDGRKARRDSPL